MIYFSLQLRLEIIKCKNKNSIMLKCVLINLIIKFAIMWIYIAIIYILYSLCAINIDFA